MGDEKPFKYREDDLSVEYRGMVRLQRKTRGAARIPNRTITSAIFVLKELIESAGSTVCLLTGELPHVVFDELAPLLRNRARDLYTRILVWDERPAGGTAQLCKSVAALSQDFPDRFALRFSGSREYGDRVPHFTVVDDRGYRLEDPHPYKFAGATNEADLTVQAEACFNDPKTAGRLLQLFDQLWSAFAPAVREGEYPAVSDPAGPEGSTAG